MMWREFAARSEFEAWKSAGYPKRGPYGTEAEGQRWSDGPGPGRQWCVTGPPGARRYVLVRRVPATETYYTIKGEE